MAESDVFTSISTRWPNAQTPLGRESTNWRWRVIKLRSGVSHDNFPVRENARNQRREAALRSGDRRNQPLDPSVRSCTIVLDGHLQVCCRI